MPLPAPIALPVRSVRFTFAGKHGKWCAWAAGSPVGLMRAASDGMATSEQRGASLRKRPSIEKPDVLDFTVFNVRRKGGTPSALVAGGGKAMLSDPEPEED